MRIGRRSFELTVGRHGGRPLQAEPPEQFLVLPPPAEPWNLQEIQQSILTAAHQEFAADLCALFSLNPITGQYLPPTFVGERLTSNDTFDPGQEPWLESVLEEQALIVSELTQQVDFESELLVSERICAFLAVTLIEPRTQNPLAVLCIAFRQHCTIDEEKFSCLQQLNVQAADQLQTAWLLARYRKVARIGLTINQNLSDEASLCQTLYEQIGGVFDVHHFFGLGIYSWQSDRVKLHYYAKGHYSLEEELSSTAIRQLIDDEEFGFFPELSPDDHLEWDLDQSDSSEFSPGSAIYVPLRLRGITLGFLVVLHENPHAFDHEDLAILKLLANHASSAVSGIRVFRNQDDINHTGQLFADLENPAETLERVVKRIRDSTGADLVVLYPYDEKRDELRTPPVFDGNLNDQTFLSQPCRRGDAPYQLLQAKDPIFLRDALQLTERLGGTRPEAGRDFQAREGIASVSAVALRFQSKPVGALFINFRRIQPFDGAQKLLISGLSVFAALAIQNASLLLEKDNRRLEELQILQDIDREIAKAVDHTRVLNTILEHANRMLKADDASILLAQRDPEDKEPKLRLVAAIGRYVEESLEWTTLDTEKSIVKWVFDHKESVLVTDFREDKVWQNLHYGLRSNILAELDVPFLDDAEVIGVLNFESEQAGAFNKDDQKFVETLARQVLLAVKRAKDAENAARTAKERGTLMDLSREIIGEIEHEKLLPSILSKAIKTARAEAGVLLLYDEENRDLVIVCEQGVPADSKGKRLALDQGIVGHVARERSKLNIDPTEPEWRDKHLAIFPNSRSELALPLLTGKRLWGVLNIESTVPKRFGDRELRLIDSLANFAVIALQNAEQLRETELRQKRLEALQDVTGQIVSELTELDTVMQSVVDHAAQLIDGTARAELRLRLEDGVQTKIFNYPKQLGYNTVEGSTPGAGPNPSPVEQPQSKFLQRVASNREALRIRGETCRDLLSAHDGDIRSALAVPLVEQNNQELLGVLAVKSLDPFAFRNSDEDFLKLFADEAVLAIQTARSYDQLERELARFDSLVQTGEKLGKFSNIRNLQDVFKLVVEKAAEQCQCLAVIRRYVAETAELVLVSQAGAEGSELFERIKIDEGLNGLVFSTRQTEYQPDSSDPPPGSPTVMPADPNSRSIVVTPIQFGESYYGNLGLSHSERYHFDPADLRLAEGLAQLLAITWQRLQTIRAQRELESRAREAEVISALDHASSELAHRLEGDLGIINPRIQLIEMRLKKLNIQDEDIEKHLEIISKQASHVIQLNDELRDEVKSLRSDKPEAIKIKEILSEAEDGFVPEAREGVELSFEVAPGTAEAIHAIPGCPGEILHQLIRNAIQAVPANGKINVRARNEGNMVGFEVQDNGPGIPEDEQENVFNLLFSTKKSTGFGLWTAKRRARLCLGELFIKESEPGRGTTFCLKLPRADLPPEVRFNE